MNNNNKRTAICIVLIILISASTLLGFFLIRKKTSRSVTASDSSVDYQTRYAFICGDPENDLFNSVYESARKRGEENGDYIEFMGRELSMSYSATDLMDMAVEARMDGIIVAPTASSSGQMTRLIDRAVENGIPVVTLISDSSESHRNAYVGYASYSVGKSFGNQIISLKGDEVKNVTILMTNGENTSNQDIIYSGIKNTIDNAGLSDSFSMSVEFIDDSEPYSAEESVSGFLQREDIPDILLCLDETVTTSACQAIVDLNRVGDTTILGFYVNSTILSAIDNGILFSTVVMDAEKMGEYCVDTLNSYREGGVVNEYMPVETHVINSANVGDYI